MKLFVTGRRFVRHGGAWFGQEILNDDFLHVTVLVVRTSYCVERVESFLTAFADAHEQSGGERYAKLPGKSKCVESASWFLVGREAVRGKIGQRLQHHSLRSTDATKLLQLVSIESAGVGVGKQSGCLQNHLRGAGHVVHRGLITACGEPASRFVVSQLGSLTQREECFSAARSLSRLGDGHHFIQAHVGRFYVRGSLSEGAVTAAVTTELGQGNKHFR